MLTISPAVINLNESKSADAEYIKKIRSYFALFMQKIWWLNKMQDICDVGYDCVEFSEPSIHENYVRYMKSKSNDSYSSQLWILIKKLW